MRSSRTEVRIERKEIADHIATGPADSSRVRDHEIASQGSSATWVQNRDQQRKVSSPARLRRRISVVGKRTELARYTVSAGARIVYGQRVDGSVSFLPDQPVVLDAPPARQRGQQVLMS